MKPMIFTMVTALSLVLLCFFHSPAKQTALINAESEKNDILALESEVIRNVNECGPRSEISRDITENDVDYDRAYRVYANSKLFNKRSDKNDDIKEQLQNGHYLWQIPIFIENGTVLVDIFKNTRIENDLPEKVKEKLRETLGQWKVGAMYVHENRTVDFQNTVKESLMAVELDPNDYTYEFVSGLPGIRYPVAIVFDESNAKYIIPAELEAAQAFNEGCESMEYTTSSNRTDDHKNNPNIFPVYNFRDVAKASRNASLIGFGSSMGISPAHISYHNVLMIVLIIGVLGVGFMVSKKLLKK